MTRQEVMTTRFGEMIDMINCLAIYNGGAEEAPHKMTFDEFFALR